MTEELEPDQFVLSRYYKVKHTGNEMWNVDAKGYNNLCSADMKNLAFETEKMESFLGVVEGVRPRFRQPLPAGVSLQRPSLRF